MISTPLRFTVVTGPAKEPVTLDTAKTHMRIDGADSDEKVANLIVAAREWVEQYTRRALMTQTLRITRDDLTSEMFLPRPPLQSVTSITYVDEDGATQTATGTLYDTDTDAEPGRVLLAYEQEWPDVRAHPNAVAVTYVAGYGSNRAEVPYAVREALLLHAEAHYDRDPREFDNLMRAAKALLAPHRAILL